MPAPGQQYKLSSEFFNSGGGPMTRPLLTPLIKEVMIRPQKAAPFAGASWPIQDQEQKEKIVLDIKFMVPVLKSARTPLSLYVECIKKRSVNNSLRGKGGPRFLKSRIKEYNKNYSSRERIVIPVGNLGAADKQNYISAEAVGSKGSPRHAWFRIIDVEIEVTSLGKNWSLEDAQLCIAAVVCAYPTHPRGLIHIGQPIFQTVIQRGKVPELSEYYVDSNDAVYPGAIHLADNAPRSGAYIGSNSMPLIKKQTANFKIKDLRPLLDKNNSINGFVVGEPPSVRTPRQTSSESSSSFDGDLMVSGDLDSKKALLKSLKGETYFSLPTYSRAPDGSATMLLSFHYLNYIRNVLEFGNIIKDRRALFNSSLIQNLRVYRYRGKEWVPSNSQTAGVGQYREDCPSSPVLVGNRGTSFIGSKSGTLHMLIDDPGMASESGEWYRYRIEVDIIDNSRALLQLMADDISNRLNKFDEYVKQFTREHARGFNTYYEIMSRMQSLEAGSKYCTLMVDSLLGSLKCIYGSQSSALYVSLKRNLLALGSPYSATTESLLLLRKIAADYLNSLSRHLSNNVSESTRPLDLHSRMFSKGATLDRVHRLVFEVQKAYRNHPVENGTFDYLGVLNPAVSTVTSPKSQDSGAGLTTVSLDKLVTRLNLEAAKFPVPDRNSISLNRFGFLTPLVLRTNGQVPQQITTGRNLDFSSSLDILYANKSVDGPIKSFVGTPDLQVNRSVLTTQLLGLDGVTAAPSRGTEIKQIVHEEASKMLEFVDSALYFSSGSSFPRGSISLDEASGSQISLLDDTFGANRRAIGDSGIVRHILQASARDYKHIDITNQGKAAFSGSFLANQIQYQTSSMDEWNIFEKQINANSLVKLEYFDGLQPDLMTPRWTMFSKNKFDRLRAEVPGFPTAILVKMTPVTPLFDGKNNFKLPICNELFILGRSGGLSHPGVPAPPMAPQMTPYAEIYQKNVGSMKKIGSMNANPTDGVVSEMLLSQEASVGYRLSKPNLASWNPAHRPGSLPPSWINGANTRASRALSRDQVRTRRRNLMRRPV